MAKKKYLETLEEVKTSSNDIGFDEMGEAQEKFKELVETDPKYSLSIDPLGVCDFTDEEADFIAYMIQYKNVQFVTTVLMNLSLQKGVEIYKSYKVQEEIKRLNRALYARRLTGSMATLDQIGSYLTSGLLDENVPIADRWSAKEKIAASSLLVKLNILKKNAVNEPKVLEVIEVQRDLEKLNPNDIKKLIEMNDEGNSEKEKLIDIINEDGLLSMEEVANLRSMPLKDLQDLVDTITKGETKDEEN